jgi:hypothetical protein
LARALKTGLAEPKKEDEMGETCGTYGLEEKYLQGFGGEN